MEKKTGRFIKLVLIINVVMSLISWMLNVISAMQLVAIDPLFLLNSLALLLVSIWGIVLAIVLVQLAYDVYDHTVET